MAQQTAMNNSEKPNSLTTNAKNERVQTAIEWIYDILTSENWEFKTYEEQDEIYKKAKAMEKEQIMDAYWNGTTDMEKQDALSEAEKFYNEYYGA